jgi:hypothetical protein
MGQTTEDQSRDLIDFITKLVGEIIKDSPLEVDSAETSMLTGTASVTTSLLGERWQHVVFGLEGDTLNMIVQMFDQNKTYSYCLADPELLDKAGQALQQDQRFIAACRYMLQSKNSHIQQLSRELQEQNTKYARLQEFVLKAVPNF